MGLTLQFPPGYSDLQDSAIAANTPALGIQVAKIYGNAVFGMVRTETFYFFGLKNGETVPLPVSPTDGYVYSRDELIYIWTINSGNGTWISGADSLFYCDWLVDQATGQVFADEWYRRSGSHANVEHTNDGIIHVFVIAQRKKSSLVMASSPSWSGVSAAWIAQDKPLTQQLIQGLNDDAKFSIVNSEVFYMGEFYNGQTVPHPVSPADGYTYSYAECKFLFSWRWTPNGNATGLSAPPISYGQMGPMIASVNGSGVVSTTVKYIDDNGNLNSTNDGRIAVFAFCTRSGTPASLSSPVVSFSSFRELSFDLFMPGQPLPFDTVIENILDDIDEAVLTPEFFGPTTYKDGDTIPTPTSAVDGYAYSRAEIQYVWTWSDTTNQTGSNLRLPLFYGNIDTNTGAVHLHVKRLPPGGGIVEDNDTLCRISVIVIARRQAQLPAVANTTTVVPQQDASTGGNAVFDVPTVSKVSVNGSAAPADPNFSDTTPAAPAGNTNVKWQKDALNPTDISAYVPSLPNFSDDETPSGSGTSYSLAHTPNPAASLLLFVDGQLMTAGATEDYTLSGANITFATAPRAGANIRAWYRY